MFASEWLADTADARTRRVRAPSLSLRIASHLRHYPFTGSYAMRNNTNSRSLIPIRRRINNVARYLHARRARKSWYLKNRAARPTDRSTDRTVDAARRYNTRREFNFHVTGNAGGAYPSISPVSTKPNPAAFPRGARCRCCCWGRDIKRPFVKREHARRKTTLGHGGREGGGGWNFVTLSRFDCCLVTVASR